jgi:hypothetical protein
MVKIKVSSLASLLTAAFVCAPLFTQAANPYQSRNTNYGVSGSNVMDITKAYCCGGTLGSLLTSWTTFYVLSSARSGLPRPKYLATGFDRQWMPAGHNRRTLRLCSEIGL